MTALNIFLIIVLFLIMGLATVSIVFGLPGTVIEFGAVLIFVLITKAHNVGWYTVGALALLTVVAEIGEMLFGIKDARKAGTSGKAMAASIAGAVACSIAAAPFLLGIGAVIGAVFGAFAGAFIVSLMESRKAGQAVYKGWISAMGRLKGTLFKGAIAIIFIVICAVEIL